MTARMRPLRRGCQGRTRRSVSDQRRSTSRGLDDEAGHRHDLSVNGGGCVENPARRAWQLLLPGDVEQVRGVLLSQKRAGLGQLGGCNGGIVEGVVAVLGIGTGRRLGEVGGSACAGWSAGGRGSTRAAGAAAPRARLITATAAATPRENRRDFMCKNLDHRRVVIWVFTTGRRKRLGRIRG